MSRFRHRALFILQIIIEIKHSCRLVPNRCLNSISLIYGPKALSTLLSQLHISSYISLTNFFPWSRNKIKMPFKTHNVTFRLGEGGVDCNIVSYQMHGSLQWIALMGCSLFATPTSYYKQTRVSLVLGMFIIWFPWFFCEVLQFTSWCYRNLSLKVLWAPLYTAVTIGYKLHWKCLFALCLTRPPPCKVNQN